MEKNFFTQFYNDVNTNSLQTTDKDFEIIKKYFTDNENEINMQDVAIFEGWLSNNIIDRSLNRVPIDTLKALSETIVGKPKLIHHDIDEIPDGRFYKSRIEKVDIESALKLIGSVPYKKKDFRKMLETVEEKDGGIFWMVSTFYMLQGTDEEKAHVRKVRAGLLRDMSLSFYVPIKSAIMEDETEVEVSRWFSDFFIDGKKVLYFEWRNSKEINAESVEGSHVFLGRLRGTVSHSDNFDTISNRLSILAQTHTSENETDNNTDDDKNNNKEPEPNSEPGAQAGASEDPQQNAEWSSAYINSLEDDCFAVVERTGKKDDEGRTIPYTARHLPHHPKGKGDPGTGGVLDMAHFNNARARMNQIVPVTKTITIQGLRDKAKKHLDAHYEIIKKQKSNAEKNLMELKITGYDQPFNILPDSMNEDLERMSNAVNHKIDTLVSENKNVTRELTELKAKSEQLEKFSNAYKEKVGDVSFEKIQQSFKDLEFLKNHFIDETITYKKLAGFEVKDGAKESFQKMNMETIMEMHAEFRSQAAEKTSNPWLKGNFETLPQTDQTTEPEAKEITLTPERAPESYRRKFMSI